MLSQLGYYSLIFGLVFSIFIIFQSIKPVINKSNLVLGWKAKEGKYDFLPMHEYGNNFILTIKKNGDRYNGNVNINVENKILLVGGSFTQGWGK